MTIAHHHRRGRDLMIMPPMLDCVSPLPPKSAVMFSVGQWHLYMANVHEVEVVGLVLDRT
jgi:hypothetical protein